MSRRTKIAHISKYCHANDILYTSRFNRLHYEKSLCGIRLISNSAETDLSVADSICIKCNYSINNKRPDLSVWTFKWALFQHQPSTAVRAAVVVDGLKYTVALHKLGLTVWVREDPKASTSKSAAPNVAKTGVSTIISLIKAWVDVGLCNSVSLTDFISKTSDEIKA
jgi:hypothetical protein